MEESGASIDARAAPSVAKEALAGVGIALPAGVAMAPLGMALGVLISQSGLPWWTAPLFTGVIFAGSLEFLLVGMILAAAPLASVALTALLVNFRHVFYALSFPLHQIRSRGLRVLSTYILCDEAWALTAHPEARTWTGARILGIQSVFYVNWVVSSTVGVLTGSLIPPSVVGLDFAITAFFVVLGIDAYRARRSVPIPLVALACALFFAVCAGDAMILPAMGAFVAVVLISYVWKRWRVCRG
ncbi:branched-chain amino acid exporter BrnF [Georgenia halophila]|uniref:Branched-chain amino acid exporter BrnF n=1 Tax=Georgenia halophila TaxID=620889 RepID=A0ABP8LJD4_9MICO